MTGCALVGLAACTASPEPYTRVAELTPVPVETPAVAMERYGIDAGNVGYVVADAETGRVLDEHQPDTGFMPASTAKLFTAYAASAVLGREHRYATKVCAADGRAYLVGGGDPALDMADLMALAQDVDWSGMGPVRRFFVDDSLYPPIRHVNGAQPTTAYYNPPVSALSTKDALRRLRWRPAEDDPATVEVFGTPAFSADGGEAATDWLLDLPQGAAGSTRFPLNDPARLTGTLFRQFAQAFGGDLPEPRAGKVPDGACAAPEAVHRSAPLHTVLRGMLRSSSNVQAELVGLSVSRELGRTKGGLAASAGAVRVWLPGAVPQADWSAMHLPNHSGLNAKARVTPRQMTALLRAGGKDGLLPLLSAAGWHGWMRDRLPEPDTALKVWAKTGTMNYGVALAGIILDDGGQRKVFAVFVQDQAARTLYDRETDKEEKERLDAAAARWNDRARSLIDALVRGWVGPESTLVSERHQGTDDGHHVEEACLHCAKATLRSKTLSRPTLLRFTDAARPPGAGGR